jgi:hypothetical protein
MMDLMVGSDNLLYPVLLNRECILNYRRKMPGNCQDLFTMGRRCLIKECNRQNHACISHDSTFISARSPPAGLLSLELSFLSKVR